ncbi:MAG: sigma factor [Actinomycetota bacterium]|nr:sigma factor [Actinomycetota bacterium]
MITESIDVREFDAFVRTNERRLARQAYALTGDLGTAQEFTQEALIRAWQRWGAVRFGAVRFGAASFPWSGSAVLCSTWR